jgi:hypothetical protein
MDHLALADTMMVGVEGNPLVEGFSLILLLGCPSQEPKILLTVAV